MAVRQQELIVYNLLIKEHTRELWGELQPIVCKNGMVNVVADEVLTVLVDQGVEPGDVYLGKLELLDRFILL